MGESPPVGSAASPPWLPNWLRPKTMLPKAMPESTTESTSIGTRRVSPRFVIQRMPRPSETSAIGRMMAKSQRQLSVSSTNPDSVGPIAGASEITRPTRPIMRPRERGGTTFIIVVMSSGIMMPVPRACTTRPVSSTAKPGATRQISVPRLKSDIAAMNTCRVVKRCSRNPVTGMMTAIESMNALVIHWPSSGGMPRSTLRCGMAMPIVVSLRIATNAATSSSQMTRIALGSTPVPVTGMDAVFGWVMRLL